MDVLRAALGDGKLTYMGKSYGTFLGALYANLFPHRVRALILDGAVDPAGAEAHPDPGARFRDGARGVPEGLCRKRRARSARRTTPRCTNSTTSARSAATHPLPAQQLLAADGRVVNRARMEIGIAARRCTPHGDWPGLQTALASAQNGDGSDLLDFADQLWERNNDGTYKNLEESNIAINCVDRPVPKSCVGVRTTLRSGVRSRRTSAGSRHTASCHVRIGRCLQ